MSTPIWSFEQNTDVFERLSWLENHKQTATRFVESKLLLKLNDWIGERERFETDCAALGGLNAEEKEGIVRHPYISGFLSEKFQINSDEFLRFRDQALAASSLELEQPSVTVLESPIRMDYQNSISIPTLDDGDCWVAEYDQAELHIEIERIRRGLQNLSLVSASAARFVNTYIWYITVRHDIRKPRTFGTYTFQVLPGLLLICNQHVEDVDQLLIEETLLHEAIHCFIDAVESQGCSILREEDVNDTVVESPWTGNPLDVHTSFHAVVVWYGLGKYFRRCVDVDLSDSHRERFRKRLQFVKQGFQRPEFQSLLKLLCYYCNQGPTRLLRQIAQAEWA